MSSEEAAQIVGLVAALVLYCAAVAVIVRVRRARIAALPSDWRDHGRLREGYERLLADRPIRRQLRERRTLTFLVPVVIASGIFALGGVSVAVEVAASAVLGAYFTQHWVAAGRRRAQRTAATLGLVVPSRARGSDSVWIASSFVAGTAMIAFGCFLGGAVGAALR